MKTMLKLIAILLPIAAFGDWLSTASGTAYLFQDTANWGDGEINGIFGLAFDEVAAEKPHLTISLTDDYTGPLSFTYAKGCEIAFQSQYRKENGITIRTIHLTDDLCLSASKGFVKFGVASNKDLSSHGLNIDLGGCVRKVATGGGQVIVAGEMSNGDVKVEGLNSKLTLHRYGGVAGDVVVDNGAMLQTLFYTSDADLKGTQVTRAQNVTVSKGNVNLTTLNSGIHQFSGALRFDDTWGFGVLTMQAAATTHNELRAGSLQVDPHGVAVIRGYNLGSMPNEDGANSSNVYFDEIPCAAGELIPRVRVGVTTAGGISTDLNQTFATYRQDRGVVPLDYATDFVTSIADITSDADSLLVPKATTLELQDDKTVRSLILEGGAATARLTGAGTLTVTSGQVIFGYNSNPTVEANLNFGSESGCITYGSGKNNYLKGAVYGSRGLTLTAPLEVTAVTQTGSNFTISDRAAVSTFTGDVVINGGVGVTVNGFLPHGERMGDVIVGANGTLNLEGIDQKSGGPRVYEINGLEGSGTIKNTKYLATLDIGAKDGQNEFKGAMTAFTNIRKSGGSIQVLSGSVACTGTFAIDVGSVILDGTVEQGAVNVAAGVALGGSGIIKTSVAFADGAKLLAKVEGKTLAAPLTVADASGTAIVEADGLWKGEACVLKAAEGETLEGLTFKRGANVGKLTLSADKTELYATPKAKGFSIVVM